MRKIFVDKITEDNVLSGADHAHVSVVLRARVGDKLTLCDGDGYDYQYEISGIDSKSTRLKFLDKTPVETEPKTKVDLFVALLKADKLEWVCQKCTELGISEINPFVSEFVQVKKESVKAERLNKICKEAAQQCGRGKVPTLNEPIAFKDMLARLSCYDNVLFLYEKGGSKLSDGIKVKGGSTAIIIGSEGGFSDKEAEQLATLGVKTISLGKRILRAETACVTAVSLVMYEMEELK
ncbi:MAG: 16S rRNA (uracil(1498)-N(3))-methyltransferase [Clostridiales bacterium]|nr:16S rRNA (uracil(1498)-N(3))-methyltransferase [Clostridiales bacterium]